MTRDQERQIALLKLLALPDAQELRGLTGNPRGYRYTQTRSGDADAIKRDLGTAYVQHVRQTYGTDISRIVSVRRQPKLKMVKRA